jgi:hypothetical protein
MPGKKTKAFKEEFARFFENPSRETLRDLLRQTVGELNELDFKEEWPEKAELAKHVLAIGNTGGGCVVFGVEDGSSDPKGLSSPKDKAEVSRELRKYVPPPLLDQLDVVDFRYEASEYPRLKGKVFQVLFIPDDATRVPFIAAATGEKVREAAIYVRRGTESVEVNYEELQRLVSRRLETGRSSAAERDVRDHLAQLRILYQQLSPTRETGSADLFGVGDLVRHALGIGTAPNPDYPAEGFDTFVARAIELKKGKVLAVLDVSFPDQ